MNTEKTNQYWRPDFRNSASLGTHFGSEVRVGRLIFSPLLLGPYHVETVRRMKRALDPDGIFNPGEVLSLPDSRQTGMLEAVLGVSMSTTTWMNRESVEAVRA